MWKTVAPRKGDLKWHMPDIHVASAMGDVAKLMELLEIADEEVGRPGGMEYQGGSGSASGGW